MISVIGKLDHNKGIKKYVKFAKKNYKKKFENDKKLNVSFIRKNIKSTNQPRLILKKKTKRFLNAFCACSIFVI